jgi:hypothetical protein
VTREDVLEAIREESDKKVAYEEARRRADELVGELFSLIYNVRKGDIVYEAESGKELSLVSFVVSEQDMGRDIESRPYIVARMKLPFGLAKPKRYFPADWITREELEEIFEKS